MSRNLDYLLYVQIMVTHFKLLNSHPVQRFLIGISFTMFCISHSALPQETEIIHKNDSAEALQLTLSYQLYRMDLVWKDQRMGVTPIRTFASQAPASAR